MSKLWMALGISLIGHIWAWFHMQGQFKYEWAKSMWWVVGFGMATIVFTVLTYLVLHEVPDTRTVISLILSVVIIAIQLSHLIIK